MRIASLLKATSFLFSTVHSAFDPTSNSNVVLYWGQNSSGNQQNLSYYCQSDDVNILVLSFVTQFTEFPLTSFCTNSNCEELANDIKLCQSTGKKILLSMGGSAGYYGFYGDQQAVQFAGTLWNLFGEGNYSIYARPFGDAVVDGFDFDIENQQQTGYVALANQLKEYYTTGTKDYYISAAPQCEYPDASLSQLMSQVELDFAFVQFYNNKCSIGQSFNWDTWLDYATNVSPNKDIKLFLGLPGSQTAATTGYTDISTIQATIQNISSSPNFGGIMLWDASQGFGNVVGGETFVTAVKRTLPSVLRAASSASVSASTLVTVTSGGHTSTELVAVSSSVSTSSASPSSKTKSESSGAKIASLEYFALKLIAFVFFFL